MEQTDNNYFHSPEFREQMENDGWLYDRWFYVKEGKNNSIAISKAWSGCDGEFTLDIYEADHGEVSVPMKSISAAVKAANAILEGTV